MRREPIWALKEKKAQQEALKVGWQASLLLAYRRSPDPLDATGPFLLTRAVASYSEQARVTIVPWELLYPIAIPEIVAESPAAQQPAEAAFGIHHWAGSWWRHPSPASDCATSER